MPVKTITAEIDGKVRKITADIPDDATPEELQSAVQDFLAVPPARDPKELPGYAEAEQWAAEQEAQPAMSFGEKAGAAVRQLGSAVISPITSIPGAIGEVADWATGGARDQVNAPNYMRGNPLAEAQGNALGAAMTTRGSPPVNDLHAALERLNPPAAKPPAPAKPATSWFSGLADAVRMIREIRKFTPGKMADAAMDSVLTKVEGMAAQPKPPAVPPEVAPVAPVPAPPVKAAAPTPTPAGPIMPEIAPAAGNAIPANVTPAQLRQFPARMVSEYLQQRQRPALADPAPARAEVVEMTPRDAAKAPAKRVARQKVEKPEPEVVTILAPKPEFESAVYEASHRAVKATKLAETLHEHGISFEDAKLMKPAEWEQVSQAIGVRKPSMQSITQALFELKKLGRGGSAVSKNPKALAAAEKLAEEMVKR